MKKFTYSIALSSALLLAPAPGFTEGGEGGFGGGHFFFGGGRHFHNKEDFQKRREEFREKMKELNLSDEQQAKLKEIRESRSGLRDRWKELGEKRQDLWQSMKDRKTSEEALISKFHELNAEQSSLQEERFKRMLKMRSVLTDEQLEKFEKMMKERRENAHESDSSGVRD